MGGRSLDQFYSRQQARAKNQKSEKELLPENDTKEQTATTKTKRSNQT